MARTIHTMLFYLETVQKPLSCALLLLVIVGIYIFNPRHLTRWSTKPLPSPDPKTDYYTITPLPSLSLATTPPLKLRPFKPTYHMTMSLSSCTFSALLAMDATFLSRCAIRRALLETQRHEVLACNPVAEPAVLELYEWLVRSYLPVRFPTVYEAGKEGLGNKVAGEKMSWTPRGANHALEVLGRNVDTEFLIMLPTAESSGVKYRLQAFINTFPSGFNTRSKLGHTLADIHAPVPGYMQKLEKSMDRYFAAMPAGKVIERANWAVSTSGDLFCLSGNHMAANEVGDAQEQAENVNLKKTVLRCERQTLYRLPETGALVFAFKTYQYPIQELRDEGSGEELAEAIEGLGRGSVPGIRIYKREVVWGEKVKAFLRGEINA